MAGEWTCDVTPNDGIVDGTSNSTTLGVGTLTGLIMQVIIIAAGLIRYEIQCWGDDQYGQSSHLPVHQATEVHRCLCP